MNLIGHLVQQRRQLERSAKLSNCPRWQHLSTPRNCLLCLPLSGPLWHSFPPTRRCCRSLSPTRPPQQYISTRDAMCDDRSATGDGVDTRLVSSFIDGRSMEGSGVGHEGWGTASAPATMERPDVSGARTRAEGPGRPPPHARPPFARPPFARYHARRSFRRRASVGRSALAVHGDDAAKGRDRL